jgi:hypothetical protein
MEGEQLSAHGGVWNAELDVTLDAAAFVGRIVREAWPAA